MKRYKLIREYPGSPKLGTEIIKSTIYGASSTKVVHTYMIKGDETFKLNNPKDYPEFWQEIVEKDYEILKIRCTVPSFGGYILTSLQNGKFANDYKQVFFEPEYYEIYQVRRLSDGEIFTIGDKINEGIIFNFNIINNKIIINYNNHHVKFLTLNGCKKIKQPLFTTEDGVDIFEGDNCWSVVKDKFELGGKVNYKNQHPYEQTLYFSTKEKAEEYILMNKPCLSINNFLKVFPKYISMSERDSIKLKELVQQKLNK